MNINKLNEYKQEFEKVKSVSDTIGRWTEQIKHLEVIKSFNIDTSKLTYSNSHGDYNIYFHNKKYDTQYILSDFRFENLQIKTQKRFR